MPLCTIANEDDRWDRLSEISPFSVGKQPFNVEKHQMRGLLA